MMHIRRYGLLQAICLCIGILLCNINSFAQPELKKYSIRDGKEMIELSRNIPDKELDAFINDFGLADLDLKNFLRSNRPDSLLKKGWFILVNNKEIVVLTKSMIAADLQDFLLEKLHFNSLPSENTNPAVVHYGRNKFKNKYPFRVEDSLVVFYLKGHQRSNKVLLAASFTNWQQNAIPMILTDSGWIAYVKLGTGKHWYKFIVDGNWTTDPDNQVNENDAEGNINSVYYKTNHNFRLDGYTNAKKVYLSGSFNDWREKELLMTRTATGWELPVALPEGTHTYKFIVDGEWIADPINPDKLPDGYDQYNSVVRFGATHIFRLDGYTKAKKVILVGSFNNWREFELEMVKTATGWELPYVIGPGNYEYKFIVDDKWIADPANNAHGSDGNSFLVISPNYTFKLDAPNAKQVMLAGDFNGWDPKSIPMKKEDDAWVFRLHLAPGKYRYKFIVDGQWILDPKNKLWEENEYGTGNSILWIGQK